MLGQLAGVKKSFTAETQRRRENTVFFVSLRLCGEKIRFIPGNTRDTSR
jgi:hypothetical protein